MRPREARWIIRGMLPVGVLTAVLLGAWAAPAVAQGWPSDPWLKEPVDETTFQTFLQFFRYDKGIPLDVTVEERVSREGVVMERLSYLSTPAERVPALFFRPAGGGWQERPAVLMLHGGIGAGKEAGNYFAYYRNVVQTGFNVLAIDLDHFGERDDGLLTTFTEEDKHEHLYNRPGVYLDWVEQTVKDAGRARDLLVEVKGIHPKKIGLVGFSRGAQLAMIVAGADPRFQVVGIVMGGHFDAMERKHLPAACPANYVVRISPRPLYFVNGVYDQDYDREKSVEPLHQLAGEPVKIRWVETGHTLPSRDVREAMFGWLRNKLPGPGGAPSWRTETK